MPERIAPKAGGSPPKFGLVGLVNEISKALGGAAIAFDDLAGVNRVREQCVEMTAREGFAAALGAIRCRAAFRAKPETVGLLLDPAHAAEFTIESEDAAHGLGLGRVDDERALVGVVAKRDIAVWLYASLYDMMLHMVSSNRI